MRNKVKEYLDLHMVDIESNIEAIDGHFHNVGELLDAFAAEIGLKEDHEEESPQTTPLAQQLKEILPTDEEIKSFKAINETPEEELTVDEMMKQSEASSYYQLGMRKAIEITLKKATIMVAKSAT